jgi:hypothetical protein
MAVVCSARPGEAVEIDQERLRELTFPDVRGPLHAYSLYESAVEPVVRREHHTGDRYVPGERKGAGVVSF